ncbi:MAG: carboxypeptidase M32 [Myxococcales bacterium]|nr:carboxypeptidase M32 [Myxococcales bacterium]
MSYAQLEATFRRIGHLDHAVAMLEWDEAVMMPAAAGPDRADAVATLYGIRHQHYTQPELSDWFAAAEEEARAGSLSASQTANLREMHRSWRRIAALPQDLVEASKKAESASEQAWRSLRAQNDWASFRPKLEAVVALKKEVAAVLGQALSLSPYDALIDGFEPGMRCARIDGLFADLGTFLPAFTEAVLAKQSREPVIRPEGPFPVDAQRALGTRLMEAVGFDLAHGRLDTSHHPFCGGVPTDVRITTRYDETDFTTSMMGVLHEAGHAKYEQGLPHAWSAQPAGAARGMAMHESQSLLQEMQISRGLPFLRFATPLMRACLGPAVARQPEAYTPENMHRLATRVRRGYIRVDADEVTYPCHVILRYEIERQLFEGQLAVADIPGMWNERMMALLGLSTLGQDKNGCMQDVHWPAGLFGYFPSYTLGALTAAQLFAAARAALPSLDDDLSLGNFVPLNAWLREQVWSKASLFTGDEILQAATGQSLSAEPFKAHLRRRYLDS